MPLQNMVDLERFNIPRPRDCHNESHVQSAIPTCGWESGHSEMAAYSTLNERSANFEGCSFDSLVDTRNLYHFVATNAHVACVIC